MNMEEYLKVREYTYLEYCDYLQNKYGIGLCDYMTASYQPIKKCKRTSEGLIAHHKKEDTEIMLCNPILAKRYPFEWQSKENIVYCDYLEHLLLHVLISEYPSIDSDNPEGVGIGGIVNYMVPELNDLFSGWETDQEWRRICHSRVKNDKQVYLAILKQFIDIARERDFIDLIKKKLCRSAGEKYLIWYETNNLELYDEIKALLKQG